jgi:hypothetical protein
MHEMNARDAYEQFSDASTTPLWDLSIGLSSLATVLGGGLAAIYAIGYLAVGRVALAWPLLTTLVVLVAINLALRHGRNVARRW